MTFHIVFELTQIHVVDLVDFVVLAYPKFYFYSVNLLIINISTGVVLITELSFKGVQYQKLTIIANSRNTKAGSLHCSL